MKRPIGLMMVAVMFGLMSCGGGGNGGGSIPPGITVRAGDRLSTTIGETLITSGVFPSDGTVTVTEKPAPAVVQPNFGGIQPMLTVSSTVQPNGGFSVSYPDTSNGAPAMAGIFDGKEPIGAFPVTKENGRMIVTMDPAYLPQNRSRDISIISIIIGIIKNYLPPDPTVSLKQVGAAGEGQGLVYIPGLLQKADDAVPAVQTVKSDRGYGSAYVVDYDWRAPVATVAHGLKDAISDLPVKSADLVGYSKGGLVGRWTLEELGGTLAFKRAMYMGVPNKGCSLTLAALYGLLGSAFLKSSLPLPFIDGPNAECLTELLPNSTLLSDLNTDWYRQNGLVVYMFVAGQFGILPTDLVVGVSSALLNGSGIENHTNGSIIRQTMEGQTHFTLDDANSIVSALQRFPTSNTGIDISFSENPVKASLDATKWASRVTFTNRTNQRVTNEALLLEGYNRPGYWNNNSWYDPSTPADEFFPRKRVEWNYVLNVDESVTLDLEHWLGTSGTKIGHLPPDLWAGSVRFILLASGENGQRYNKEVVLKLKTPYNVPNDPQTRAVLKATVQDVGGSGRRE